MKSKIYIAIFLLLFVTISCSKKADKPASKSDSSKALSDNPKTLNFTTLNEISMFSEHVKKIEQAYKKIGYNIKLHQLPSLRAIQESLNNNTYDGELGRVKEAEKILVNHIRIKVPIFKLKIRAFYIDENIKINNKKDLDKYKFGFVRGSLLVESNFDISKAQALKDHYQCFDMLKAGRLEVIVTEEQFINGPWAKDIKDRIKISENSLTEHNVYHFLHKKHEALVAQLTKAFSEVTGNPIEAE